MASSSQATSPTADSPDPDSPVQALLAAAVSAIGGTERSGQAVMAQAVWDAVTDGTHLAVQAGTGTGKSLAYLVPALQLAADKRGPVVVSTATIALQRQLVDRDLPRLADALREPLGRAPKFAILKGRNNYLCLNKLRNGPEDEQDALFDALGQAPASALGAHVKRLHQWAAATTTGDRDELVPGVPDQAWRQAAVTARECLGVGRCQFGARVLLGAGPAARRRGRRRRDQPRAARHRHARRGRHPARAPGGHRRRGARARRPGHLRGRGRAVRLRDRLRGAPHRAARRRGGDRAGCPRRATR